MGGVGWQSAYRKNHAREKLMEKKTHTCGVLTQKTYSCTGLKNNATCRYTHVNV